MVKASEEGLGPELSNHDKARELPSLNSIVNRHKTHSHSSLDMGTQKIFVEIISFPQVSFQTPTAYIRAFFGREARTI